MTCYKRNNTHYDKRNKCVFAENICFIKSPKRSNPYEYHSDDVSNTEYEVSIAFEFHLHHRSNVIRSSDCHKHYKHHNQRYENCIPYRFFKINICFDHLFPPPHIDPKIPLFSAGLAGLSSLNTCLLIPIIHAIRSLMPSGISLLPL